MEKRGRKMNKEKQIHIYEKGGRVTVYKGNHSLAKCTQSQLFIQNIYTKKKNHSFWGRKNAEHLRKKKKKLKQ